MARIFSKRRERLRKIEEGARETTDPVERLRYVRGQMDSIEPLDEFRWALLIRTILIGTITAMAVALGAAVLLWRHH